MKGAKISVLLRVCIVWMFINLSITECYASNDNVIIQDLFNEYIIKEVNGQMTQVKNNETMVFLAQRSADKAYAVTSYSDDITIDKASAPGTKPMYLQDDDEDVLFSGDRICALAINLNPNKSVKATFQRTYTKPEQFCVVGLYSTYFVEHLRTIIRVPSALENIIKITPVRLKDGMKFTREERGNEIIYTVEATNLEPYKYEKHAPGVALIAPCLKVQGYFKDVYDLYHYLNKRISYKNERTESIDSLARLLTNGKDNVYDKIDTIASWVRQNIRYIAVENGDYGIYPEDATVVLHKRYGDCKGSAGLIRSLLRSSGIDGRFVWLGTKESIDCDWTDFPILSSGNHMIAAAVVNDSIIYLDGTMRYCPAGYISSSLRGAQTIVEKNSDECIIDHIPDVNIDNDTDSLFAEIKITEDKVFGRLYRCFKGVMHHIFCDAYYDNKKSKQQDILKTYLAYPKNATTSFSNIVVNTGADNNRDGSIVEADFEETASISRTTNALYVSIYPIKEAFLDLVDLNDRLRGMKISFPHRYVSHIIINIPEGYAVDAIPMIKEVHSKWFDSTISYTYSDDSKSIVCNAEFRTKEMIVNNDELKSWNQDYKNFMSGNQWRLVFKKQ